MFPLYTFFYLIFPLKATSGRDIKQVRPCCVHDTARNLKVKVFIYPFLIHGTVSEDDNSIHLTRITV